jgi:hypothetical protein
MTTTILSTVSRPIGLAFFGLACATAAYADGPLPYNTGVNATGTPLSSLAVDPHYSIVGSPAFGPQAYVRTEADGNPIQPGGWLLDDSASAWISPSTTFFFNDLPGITDAITYRTTFDLTGYIPTGGELKGQWAADDSGLRIRINGQVVPSVGIAQYDQWTPFTISNGFVNGLNTLEFDTLSTQSPTGLRIEFTSSVFAVPEPGTWALFGAGLLGVAGLVRQRAAQS